MLQRSSIQLLRFHFSFFLLPVYLFAISQVPAIDVTKALLAFFILHLLVYPSSNGYNSYMDRDETPIGGLAAPPQPTRQLLHFTIVMDLAAIILSLFISRWFAIGILLYIAASRAYSFRGIRLKKYPVVGFLTVFLFQGAVIFFICYQGAGRYTVHDVPLLPCLIASFLIGALYPLSQVYQHQADQKDGITTISILMGKRGTFVFSMIFFLSATFLLYLRFNEKGQLNLFILYLFVMLPVVLFFLYWMMKVWRNEEEASFRNSLKMNVVATLCTSAYFLTLIILNH
ncbi:MAG TPA: UbiA family prenyltransferase [Flavisolibacter sp.]|nr:UbiA family prenyltransferase [Flavisolibacter sp.]